MRLLALAVLALSLAGCSLFSETSSWTKPGMTADEAQADLATCKEIAWAAGAGITTGFVDGSFRPAAPVSRQAAAAFLSRLGVQIAAA